MHDQESLSLRDDSSSRSTVPAFARDVVLHGTLGYRGVLTSIMPTQEEVREALKTVEDPELHIGIVDLGLVYGVAVAGAALDDVTVTMTLTSPMCPVGPMFKEAVETRVRGLDGVTKANVEITFTPPWDPRTMASDDAKVLLGIW